MKILLVSPLFPPQGSGAEISTMLECEDLIKKGVEVILVTNNYLTLNKDEEWMKRLKVYQVPMVFTSFTYPRAKPFGEFMYWFLQGASWKYIQKVASKENVDLIHVEHAYIGFKKGVLIPVVLTIRDYWPICVYRTLMDGKGTCCAYSTFMGGFPCRRSTYLKYGITKLPHLLYNIYFNPVLYCMNNRLYSMIRRKIKEVDQIIAISNFVKEVISSNLGLSSETIEVIHPPILEKSYIPKSRHFEEITFTYIGALEVHKGIMNLIRAFHKIIKKNNAVKLLICGAGSLEPHIKEYISRNGLTKYIRFLGKVNYKGIHQVYEETDVVVVPSLWPEPFGRVTIDSLIAGKPVIVNPVGGLKEQVEDGVSGFYVNCYKIDELTEKILEVASLPRQELEEVGIKARQYTLKKFNSEKRINRLISIYNKVLENYKKGIQ
jgi:glycosyltransferase involved in cell wall biosynthesis